MKARRKRRPARGKSRAVFAASKGGATDEEIMAFQADDEKHGGPKAVASPDAVNDVVSTQRYKDSQAIAAAGRDAAFGVTTNQFKTKDGSIDVTKYNTVRKQAVQEARANEAKSRGIGVGMDGTKRVVIGEGKNARVFAGPDLREVTDVKTKSDVINGTAGKNVYGTGGSMWSATREMGQNNVDRRRTKDDLKQMGVDVEGFDTTSGTKFRLDEANSGSVDARVAHDMNVVLAREGIQSAARAANQRPESWRDAQAKSLERDAARRKAVERAGGGPVDKAPGGSGPSEAGAVRTVKTKEPEVLGAGSYYGGRKLPLGRHEKPWTAGSQITLEGKRRQWEKEDERAERFERSTAERKAREQETREKRDWLMSGEGQLAEARRRTADIDATIDADSQRAYNRKLEAFMRINRRHRR